MVLVYDLCEIKTRALKRERKCLLNVYYVPHIVLYILCMWVYMNM